MVKILSQDEEGSFFFNLDKNQQIYLKTEKIEFVQMSENFF